MMVFLPYQGHSFEGDMRSLSLNRENFVTFKWQSPSRLSQFCEADQGQVHCLLETQMTDPSDSMTCGYLSSTQCFQKHVQFFEI